MAVLYSERLILRPFREDDLDAFHSYSKNPNVGPNAGWKPHESRVESRAILKTFMISNETWAIIEKTSGKLCGSVGFHNDSKRAGGAIKSLGYALGEEHWGRGYATEAAKRVIKYGFEEMKLELISIYHFAYNVRSKRVIEKCGFMYEGTLRMGSRNYDQSVYDEVCYSMTRAEYEKLYR